MSRSASIPPLRLLSLTKHAQYTVTMFLVDVAPSMGKLRPLQMAGMRPGKTKTVEMTNLEWSLQYVMLKIQEMVRVARLQRGPSLLTRK